MHTSRLAQLASGLAGTGLLLFLGMPLLVQLNAMTSLRAFPLFMLGGLLAILGGVTGLIALYPTRPSTGRAGRRRSLSSVAIGAAILGVVLFTAGPSMHLPPINDITTDPSDPPVFVALAQDPANRGRDMSYPGEEFAAQQRQAYRDLAPIRVGRPPTAVHAEALEAMRGFGWEIERSDPARGAIEAMHTSKVFRFVDDIVVRVRADAGGSRVDVRSKSREGRGDLGANAARIRRLRDALLDPAS